MRLTPLLPLPLLAACATTTLPATHDGSPDDREIAYACSNGETLAMRYFPANGVAVLVRNGQAIELQQQQAATGFVYSNGPNTVRGTQGEITVEIGRMVPLRCKAR